MSKPELQRADEIDVTVTDESDLPEGWEKTHEEGRFPIKDGMGYYIYTYESEHFLISQDTDERDGETVHHVALLKVKRDDSGERQTSLGTGVYCVVGVEDGKQAFANGDDEPQFEVNKTAHEEAEQAAFQLAVDLMQEVNAGEHSDKRY